MREQEGFVPVDGYRIWYRIVGGGSDQERVPLLILHGGPGAPHDYLENLEAMASDTQRVIFYDQLGCGLSDHPDDPSLCQVSRFANGVCGAMEQKSGLSKSSRRSAFTARRQVDQVYAVLDADQQRD